MGKGELVTVAYQLMREGSPQPMMATKVERGRARSEDGVMDSARVEMYCWQFYICSIRHGERLRRGG
jgi:hypothetical protein